VRLSSSHYSAIWSLDRFELEANEMKFTPESYGSWHYKSGAGKTLPPNYHMVRFFFVERESIVLRSKGTRRTHSITAYNISFAPHMACYVVRRRALPSKQKQTPLFLCRSALLAGSSHLHAHRWSKGE